MSTRSSNHAAYLVGVGKPLEVREGPTGKPGSGQLRIRNGAVAINPVDWKMQDSGAFVQSWPTVLGCDLAGEVVEVGEGVGDFKPGQRVLAHPVGLATGEVVEDAFQNYTIVRAVVTAPIPDDMSFEQACVLPLSLSTAADGLFGKSHLGFPYPSNNPKKSGKTLLVWGGSSSVGSSVIQLAVAAGFDVVTTASKRNFEYCKKLGAKAVFDHSSPSIVGDLVAELQKGEIAGAYDGESDRGYFPSYSRQTRLIYNDSNRYARVEHERRPSPGPAWGRVPGQRSNTPRRLASDRKFWSG